MPGVACAHGQHHGEGRMSSARVVTVFIDSPLVDAGDIPPPEVGAVITLPLAFIEDTSPTSSDRGVTTVRAGLDLSDDPPRLRGGRMGVERHWQWTGVLRGDGWTAQWVGTRPRTGQVELTGRFSVRPWAREKIRGRVARVTLVSTMIGRSGGDGARVPAPDANQPRCVDVESTPRWLNRDERRGADPLERVSGVLVDLDLDGTPPRELRPAVIPGDVSASGPAIWVLDQQLPVLSHVAADRSVTEYLFPGAPAAGRRVHATPQGCWVSGPDGLYRITLGRPAYKVREGSTTVAVTVGEDVLVRPLTGPWAFYRPDGESAIADLPDGPVSASVDGDSVVVAVNAMDDELRVFRLSLNGEKAPDAFLAPNPLGHRTQWVMAGSPPRLVVDASAGPTPGVGDSAISVVRLPTKAVAIGVAGRWVWTVTRAQPSDLASSPRVGSLGDASWLLTIFDGTTLSPLLTTVISTLAPRVAGNDEGRFWLITGGELTTLARDAKGASSLCPLSFGVN